MSPSLPPPSPPLSLCPFLFSFCCYKHRTWKHLIPFFVRNKQRENHHKLKQMQKKQKQLKWKSQQSNHCQKSSSPDTSSDDDSYSNKKRVSLFLRHHYWQIMMYIIVERFWAEMDRVVISWHRSDENQWWMIRFEF